MKIKNENDFVVNEELLSQFNLTELETRTEFWDPFPAPTNPPPPSSGGGSSGGGGGGGGDATPPPPR